MSIGSLGSVSGFSSSSTFSSNSLTNDTKKKLENLGIDTKKIKTETEGRQILKEAELLKNETKSGGVKDQEEMVKTNASSLAAKMGVSVSNSDKLTEMIDKIGNKITNLRTEAAQDPTKLEKLSQYEAEFKVIAAQATDMDSKKQTNKSKLSNSMLGIAAYNKAFHKL